MVEVLLQAQLEEEQELLLLVQDWEKKKTAAHPPWNLQRYLAG